MEPTKFICHSRTVLEVARRYGWKSGARYTNLRDVRKVSQLGFLDIDWKNYSFETHLAAAKRTLPDTTVARDVLDANELDQVLGQAAILKRYAKNVVVVPKDKRLSDRLLSVIPTEFILGYSVPTRYGGTDISVEAFDGRPVHLLGGRPDVQRRLANCLNVVSLDTNRFTLDAAYGDYFDGEKFRPHPIGGYVRCIEESLRHINALWQNYSGVERAQVR